MKLLIMQFSPASYYPSLLGPNVFFSTSFQNTIILCSFLRARDQASHSFKPTDEIVISYILMFNFFIADVKKYSELNLARIPGN
jgi:hypothetical protein